MEEPLTRKSPDFQGFSNALEWTRTTTDHTVHKALNLVHGRHMRPPASRSSVLCGFADAWDASDKMTCVRDVSRILAAGQLDSVLVPALDGVA